MNDPAIRRLRCALALAALVTAACSRDALVGPGDFGAAAPDLAGSRALAPTGTVTDECGPTDGPALVFLVGVPAACGMGGGTDPRVGYFTYSGSTSTLSAGQSWSFVAGGASAEMSVLWCPTGSSGPPCAGVANGHIRITSVDGMRVGVRYDFLTLDEQVYAGDATVAVCPSMPHCG